MLCSTAKRVVFLRNSPEDGVPYCRLIEYGIINCLLKDLGTTVRKYKMKGPKGRKMSEILLIITKKVK